MQGTGCFDDKEAVQSALQDAKGSPDEVRNSRLFSGFSSHSACWTILLNWHADLVVAGVLWYLKCDVLLRRPLSC